MNESSFSLSDEKAVAACEAADWDYDDPKLQKRLGEIEAERRQQERLQGAVKSAQDITACAYVFFNQDDPRCASIIEDLEASLKENSSGWKQRRNEIALKKLLRGFIPEQVILDQGRAVCESHGWDYRNTQVQDALYKGIQYQTRREAVNSLFYDLHQDGITERVQSSIDAVSKRIGTDMIVSTVGANLAIPATIALLSAIGGPKAAATYAALEAGLTIMPLIPGVPGIVRAGYFGVGRGVEDGIQRFRKLREQGRKDISLAKEIRRSVLLGLPTGVDFGYFLIPIIAAFRNMDIDITADAMNIALKKGVPLYRLLKKQGKLDLLDQVRA